MALDGDKKRKTWPAFASWVQDFLQANEDEALSKPLGLESALYLVSTPIGNLGDMTLRGLWVLAKADAVLCEDTRVTGALLHHYGLRKPLIACHDHNEGELAATLLRRLAQGEALALVSDAGTPVISDPGYKVVRACRQAGFPVFSVPGACAALAALTSAGLPTDRFFFNGFLPAKQAARLKALEALTPLPATLVFYESPQRIAATLEDMIAVFGPEREAALAREMTKLYEEVRLGTLGSLAQELEEGPALKGEIVLLLGGAQEGGAADAATLDTALRQALESMSVRDAVAFVALALNMKKSLVYQRALELSREI